MPHWVILQHYIEAGHCIEPLTYARRLQIIFWQTQKFHHDFCPSSTDIYDKFRKEIWLPWRQVVILTPGIVYFTPNNVCSTSGNWHMQSKRICYLTIRRRFEGRHDLFDKPHWNFRFFENGNIWYCFSTLIKGPSRIV